MLSDDDSSKPDAVWNEFVRQMWRYQYVNKVKSLPDNILDEPVTKVLYNESQGIIAVALTVFLLAQKRAIMSKVEEITSDVMKSAVRDNQNLISKMIDSIRLGQKKSIHGEVDFEPPVFRANKSSNNSAGNEAENGDGSSLTFKAALSAEKMLVSESISSTALPKKGAAGSGKKHNGSPEKKLKKTAAGSVNLGNSTDSLNSIGIDSYLKSPADLL